MKDIENVRPLQTLFVRPIMPKYIALPKFFKTVEDWPQQSNLKCWHCNRTPKSTPKFIPMQPIITADNSTIYPVHGHFDTWNCAVAYAIYHSTSASNRKDSLQLIVEVEFIFSGVKKYKIEEAPSPTEMIEYCGNGGITEDEYGEKIDQINKEYSFNQYSMNKLTPS